MCLARALTLNFSLLGGGLNEGLSGGLNFGLLAADIDGGGHLVLACEEWGGDRHELPLVNDGNASK